MREQKAREQEPHERGTHERGSHDQVEVLLIHRPKYDDWSFPKGKLEPGENAQGAAVREVREETGVRVRLGPVLPSVRYLLANGSHKVVRYWAATPLDSEGPAPPVARGGAVDPLFRPNREVDACGWFGRREAAQRLTHPRDRALLDQLRPVATQTLVVLRHGHALARDRWSNPDGDRPLSPEGLAEADKLRDTLEAYGIRRIVSSPARRCVDTVLPYAARHGLAVDVDPAFTEDAPGTVVEEAVVRLRQVREPTVLCTHRPTLPLILEALGVDPVALAPAEFVVAHLHDTALLAVEYARGADRE
jgi:8-oxo-(d)GTP phosphatase